MIEIIFPSSFGKALLKLGNYADAMKELQKAYTLQPLSEDIKKAIQQVS